ncbi:MAG: hypothetical protein ACLFNI_03165 [Natronomonas sp.]
MVTKITLFEPHFDGAQFGPTSLPDDLVPGATASDDDSDVDESSETAEPESGSGMSKLGLVLAAGGVTLGMFVGALAVRRLRRRGGSTDGDSGSEDADLESETDEKLAVA